jgi:hypothetical protein
LEEIVKSDPYNEITGSIMIRQNLEWENEYRQPFLLEPAKAYYVGSYYVVYTVGYQYSNFGAKAEQHFNRDTEILKREYPGFEKIECEQVFRVKSVK